MVLKEVKRKINIINAKLLLQNPYTTSEKQWSPLQPSKWTTPTTSYIFLKNLSICLSIDTESRDLSYFLSLLILYNYIYVTIIMFRVILAWGLFAWVFALFVCQYLALNHTVDFHLIGEFSPALNWDMTLSEFKQINWSLFPEISLWFQREKRLISSLKLV